MPLSKQQETDCEAFARELFDISDHIERRASWRQWHEINKKKHGNDIADLAHTLVEIHLRSMEFGAANSKSNDSKWPERVWALILVIVGCLLTAMLTSQCSSPQAKPGNAADAIPVAPTSD